MHVWSASAVESCVDVGNYVQYARLERNIVEAVQEGERNGEARL